MQREEQVAFTSIKKKPKRKRLTNEEIQQLNEYRANLIKDKQVAYIVNKITFKLKKRCRQKDGEMIEMQCVSCEKWLRRDTRNFIADHGAANFELCAPGHESLHNSAKYPCIKCNCALRINNRATNTEALPHFIRANR